MDWRTEKSHEELMRGIQEGKVANDGTSRPSKVVAKVDYDLFVNFDQIDDKVVWPLSGILVNLPTRLVDGGRSKLRDELLRRGLNSSTCIHYLCDYSGFTALVEFEQGWTGLCSAMLFEKAYAEDHHGKKEWYGKSEQKSGFYAWIARHDDYSSSNIVGEYLRNNGFLKNIPEIMEEELRPQVRHVSELTEVIEEKCWIGFLPAVHVSLNR
ncbi:XS domain containing protein [Parasponia andersonii]|uniref:XS domain containing protein n=1 Tax=Parasponia andersonii TaxID=3476 RepID=A0A2P5B7H6_PARAD|nr:XS domain containing protein [Parasponia andersonii]